MADQILITYATKYGGTAEIAPKIGQVLNQAGWQPEVKPVDEVGDLDPYRAVVLGSAVYIGGWRKDAVKFLRANERILAERPVWLFSSGPLGGGDQAAFINGKCLPERLLPIVDRIQPRDIAIFSGRILLEKLKPLDKWMIKKTETPPGDFRNWEAITSWAMMIAETLKQVVS